MDLKVHPTEIFRVGKPAKRTAGKPAKSAYGGQAAGKRVGEPAEVWYLVTGISYLG
ncbi:MAG TPA: hypothetical protein VMX13_07555 [Sedimentisphaerales bacterium]|nr:hypothetical protein [Sedimentisphaerales bacterium]